jgi:hypothetical protein
LNASGMIPFRMSFWSNQWQYRNLLQHKKKYQYSRKKRLYGQGKHNGFGGNCPVLECGVYISESIPVFFVDSILVASAPKDYIWK